MNLYSWLRMWVPSESIVPTSEEMYNAHIDLIDVAMPTNGGKLQGDGSWLQETWKINGDWPQSLPGLAASAGQSYIPTVNCDGAQITAVLDSPTLQETAATNLIQLATVDRFDAPWDGILIDFEGIPSAYKPQLSDFLLLLSYHIHMADLVCGVSTDGKVSDPGPDYDGRYSHDQAVVAQVADFVDLRMYGYWNPTGGIQQNRSMCPYWWAKDCIEYSLSRGIPHQHLLFGLGNYSRVYPTGQQDGAYDATYTYAMQLADDVNAPIQWIECNEFGLVRERLIDLGQGHIWVSDGDTVRHRLDLVDEYGLGGVALFIPGCGDAYHWDVLEDWKSQASSMTSISHQGIQLLNPLATPGAA